MGSTGSGRDLDRKEEQSQGREEEQSQDRESQEEES